MRKKITPYPKKKIARLKAEGHTCAYIAKKIKHSYCGVYYYFDAEHRAIQLAKRYPKKKYSARTPAEKKRLVAYQQAWQRKHKNKISKWNRRRYREVTMIKRQQQEHQKRQLVIEIGKQLGLYENHR